MGNVTDAKTLWLRIEKRFKAKKLTMRSAGIAMGSADAFRNIKRAAEADKPYNPRTDTLDAMAETLETTTEWLLTGKGEEQRDSIALPLPQGVLKPPPAFVSDTLMRVYASAEGGGGELLLSNEPIEYLKPPAGLEGVESAFGILFTGESMIPAIKPGQIGWLDPRLPPMNGEEHVFFSSRPDLGEERAMVKELVRHSPDKWHVQQWNPEKTFDLTRREWQTCYRVMAKFNRR